MANKEYLSPFPEAAIVGFRDWWAFEWSKYSKRKLSVAIIGSSADLRKANDQWHAQNLPTFLITPARMELNGDRAGGAARFRTMANGYDLERGKAVVRRMAPVRVGYTTVFRTDDFNEINAYSQLLLNSYPGTTFYFEDDTGFRVECRVYLDNSVDYPEMDTSNPGDLFVLNNVISMTTLIGNSEEQGLIRQIKVNFQTGGSAATLLDVDVETGHVQQLEEMTLNYTGPFDKRSSQWKGN